MAKRRLVFVSDTQAPYHLPQAVALAAAFIKDYKPDTLVLGGDIIDFVSISRFTKVGRFTPVNVADEITICEEEVVKPLCAAHPKADVYWIEGNHEFRLTSYVAAMAKPLEGLIDVVDALGCKRNDITYIRSKAGNGILRLTPHLTLMHGDAHGANPAQKQYLGWGGSLIMGHAHKESTWRSKKGCGSDHVALAAGCLCQDPDWRDIDSYTRGFVAGWYDDVDGSFGLDHVRISGKDHTEIYSPWGEYHAEKHGTSWTAKRRNR